jgi:hypothetical protein
LVTKIGVIAEGNIDRVLLEALLTRIAEDRADFTWPVEPDDMVQRFFVRKSGHGAVLKTVRALARGLRERCFDHALFVILLDHKPRQVQRLIKKEVGDLRDRFVIGLAIREIEAWWLGDRGNTLAWSDLSSSLPPSARYARKGYRAEKDAAPKRTLDELTRLSPHFDRAYGQGNLDQAIDFVDRFWRTGARLDDIARECPKGFGAFQTQLTDGLKRAKTQAGLMFR